MRILNRDQTVIHPLPPSLLWDNFLMVWGVEFHKTGEKGYIVWCHAPTLTTIVKLNAVSFAPLTWSPGVGAASLLTHLIYQVYLAASISHLSESELTRPSLYVIRIKPWMKLYEVDRKSGQKWKEDRFRLNLTERIKLILFWVWSSNGHFWPEYLHP